VEVSAHHAHLTQDHVEMLYGAGHHLTKHADLSPAGPVRVQGAGDARWAEGAHRAGACPRPGPQGDPGRDRHDEQFKLGVHPPVRESGDIADTPGCTLEGPEGSVKLERGVICARRHIHMAPADALRYGVRDKSVVRVRVSGERELVFGDVLVRVDPNFKLAMHIDTDEGNAAGIETGVNGYIDGIEDDR
jgi:acetate kinase